MIDAAEIQAMLNEYEGITEAMDQCELLANLVTALTPPEGCALVIYHHSIEHGYCYDCGRPAAFHRASDDNDLCGICAANAAVDGETITRIGDES